MTYPDDAALAAWVNADLERRRQARIRFGRITEGVPYEDETADRGALALRRAVRLHVMRAIWTDAGKPALTTPGHA